MNRSPIKVHRGVDNKLNFRVFDPDRNPVSLCGMDVYARIIEPHDRIVVREKLCKLGSAKGMIFLELNEGDLQDITAGLYHMVLLATKPFMPGSVCNIPNEQVGEVVSRPLFTDLSNDIMFTLEITEQAYRQPYPTQEVLESEWTPGSLIPVSTPFKRYFYSKSIHGSRVINHVNGIHTFTVNGDKLTGTLEILGTLEPTPSADPDTTRWFKIYPSSMSQDVQFKDWSGTEAFTFQANFLWLKFRWFPDPNQPNLKPTKILVRT